MALPGELPRRRPAVRRPRLQMRARCGAGCLPVTTGLRGRGPDQVNPGVHLPLTRSTPGFTALRRAGHTVNVASITRRRAQMTGPLGNLANMALPGRLPFSGPDRGSRMGHVCHDPPLSGHVCHNPQRSHASRRVTAATGHTENAASITRRRAEQAGRLGDLAKTALSVRKWYS
jgi:hypothetical protein